MPTNRSKRTRDRAGAAGLTENALIWFWWAGTIGGWGEDKSEEEIQAFWQKHKKEIISWYIERNRQRKGEPGKRPSFFWDELEPENPRKKTGILKWWGPWGKDGPPKEPEVDDVFESDAEFLDRLGLLTGWEKEQYEAEKGRKRGKKL